MPIKIKIDEDLPRLAVNMLREHGYDAANVIEQGMGGWKDPKLKHAGVLLLRPDQDGIRPMMDLLEQVLSSYLLDDLAATTTVVTPRGIRVRKGK